MIFRLTCLLLALASFWLCVSPVHAKGSTDAVQITTDHFRLSGVMVPEDGIAMISELERYRAALLEVHGLPADTPDRRVDIYIVSDPDIFDVLGVGENFVALYSPTLAGPRALINGSLGVQAFAYASDPAAELEAVLRQNLRHEYGHHFINNFLPVPHPTWIGEGLAEYYAGYDELPDGGYRFGVPQATSVVALSYPVQGWRDMRAVLASVHSIAPETTPRRSRPTAKGWITAPDGTSLFYAQSWALVHWMMNRSGQTDIPGGLAALAGLSDRLLAHDSPPPAELSPPPTFRQQRQNAKAKAVVIGRTAQLELGLPLQPPGGAVRIDGTLEQVLFDYIAGDLPVLSRPAPHNRPNFSLDLQILTPAQAAALQYRQMALTAGPRGLTDSRMKTLRREAQADPALNTSLKISDAALQYAGGDTQSAIDLIEAIRVENPTLSPEEQALDLAFSIAKFRISDFKTPEAMRARLRPVLDRYPNDIPYLVMMAETGIGDLIRANATLPPEVREALAKISAMDLERIYPRAVLPLANLYLQQEDYARVLPLLHRVRPYLHDSQEVDQMISQIGFILEDGP